MAEAKDLRSTLGRVRGLGSAKDGLHHWWMQRLTALALVPLSIYFVYSIMMMVTSKDSGYLISWLAQPHAAILMVLFLGAMFYHAKLGLQVVIEDYVHTPCCKYFLLVSNTFAAWLLASVSILAVVRLHFLDLFSSSL